MTDLVVGGEPIDVTGEPNQVVEIPGGFGTVTINRQTVTDNPDGTSTITVDALVTGLGTGEAIIVAVQHHGPDAATLLEGCTRRPAGAGALRH